MRIQCFRMNGLSTLRYPSHIGVSFRFALFCALACVILSSCDKPNPTPELSDPIYRELQTAHGLVVKDVAEAEKELLEAKEALNTIIPQTRDRKQKTSAYFNTKKKLRLLKEREVYFSERLKTRRIDDRRSYLEAYRAKEPWPNPQEAKDYNTHMRLRTELIDWSRRAPASEPKKSEKANETPKKAEH